MTRQQAFENGKELYTLIWFKDKSTRDRAALFLQKSLMNSMTLMDEYMVDITENPEEILMYLTAFGLNVVYDGVDHMARNLVYEEGTSVPDAILEMYFYDDGGNRIYVNGM